MMTGMGGVYPTRPIRADADLVFRHVVDEARGIISVVGGDEDSYQFLDVSRSASFGYPRDSVPTGGVDLSRNRDAAMPPGICVAVSAVSTRNATDLVRCVEAHPTAIDNPNGDLLDELALREADPSKLMEAFGSRLAEVGKAGYFVYFSASGDVTPISQVCLVAELRVVARMCNGVVLVFEESGLVGDQMFFGETRSLAEDVRDTKWCTLLRSLGVASPLLQGGSE